MTTGQLLNSLGGGLSFLLASSFIKESSPDNSSSCDSVNNSMTSVLATPRLSFLPSSDETSVRSQIQYYMYSLAGPCIILCILCMAYFPSQPPTPPSISSTQERSSFLVGCKQIVTNPSAWVIALVWSVPQGITQTWSALMVVNFTKVPQSSTLN